MTQPRSQAELVTLRKLAQDLAQTRKERMSSVHLLAVIAASETTAGELLRERRLDQESLLKASRSFDDDGPDPLGRAFAAARDIAARHPEAPAPQEPIQKPSPLRSPPPVRTTHARLPTEPSALHLLLALLADRASAAHRSLVHAGVDLAKLRAAALQIALGAVKRRAPITTPPPAMKPVRAPMTRPPSGILMQSARRPITERPSRPSAEPVAVPILPPPRIAEAKRRIAPEPSMRIAPPAPLPEVEVERFALDKTRFPVLATVGHNLTLAAARGELEEIIGRDEEIDRVLDVLGKRHANSPCLVGPPGVGKTAVARGVAARLARAALDDRVVVEIVVSELLSGTSSRGALAERLAVIRGELREARGKVIVFFDEIHDLFAAGEEASAELKVALARGDIPLIGATSTDELRRLVEADGALARRFTPIEIEEPNEEDAFLLLKNVSESLGRHHGLGYADDAIAASVSWSIRYLPGRALPDKAIGVLDLAGARAKRRHGASRVGLPEVAAVVAELGDVPVERLLETDRERMLALDTLLAERVVGHSASLGKIARVLRRNAAGLRARRPIGSFLLLGPTGVGKTETAKAIAEALFHSPDAMTRLDLSEYAEAHAIARLVGAPPGYVGHEAGGQLTEAVRRRPYQVILLDEIEKAHRDVLEAFLQVFDEGRMTDGRGRRVDLTNTVIVMTSNLGAAEAGALKSEQRVGFARGRTEVPPERLADTMIAAARATLPPELYNRIDEVLCYSPLTRVEVAEIARRLIDDLAQALEARGVRLDVEPEVVDALLASGGFDPDLGARPMRRAINRLIEGPLSELILRGDLEGGAVALVSVDGQEIIVDAVNERAA